MSRIGKQPIIIPTGVEVHIEEQEVSITSGKNSLTARLPRFISCQLDDAELKLELSLDSTSSTATVRSRREAYIARQLHGSYRTMLQNMITGVFLGFRKKMYLRGTGFKASLSTESELTSSDGSKQRIVLTTSNKLILLAGYSHPVEMIIPENLTITVENPTTIIIGGIEKEAVGQFAAKIRSIRPPEPYKGKGIMYEGESIKRKAVKANK
jgi:large subunit ribosomal protein L6